MNEIIIKFEQIIGDNYITSVYINGLLAFDTNVYIQENNLIESGIDPMCADLTLKTKEQTMPYEVTDDELNSVSVIRSLIGLACTQEPYEE